MLLNLPNSGTNTIGGPSVTNLPVVTPTVFPTCGYCPTCGRYHNHNHNNPPYSPWPSYPYNQTPLTIPPTNQPGIIHD